MLTSLSLSPQPSTYCEFWMIPHESAYQLISLLTVNSGRRGCTQHQQGGESNSEEHHIDLKHKYIQEREMFYLTTHSTHFIYGYIASDIWLRTILIVRKETRFRHIGYSYRLTARVLLYAPSHRQDNTYHGLCYTSRGALAGTTKYIQYKLLMDHLLSHTIVYLIIHRRKPSC